MLYAYKGDKPKIHESCFVAPSADVIGTVIVGEGSSIWYNATVRGDIASITIGKNVSIQDNSVVHTAPEGNVIIGDNVVVGHSAVIHGCSIGNNCIVGMGAKILSYAKVGDNCIIGAGSVITEKAEIPDNSIVLGIPGKVVKQVSEAHLERIKKNVEEYNKLTEEYMKEVSKV